MREEHAKLVQLDQAKKALETEVGVVLVCNALHLVWLIGDTMDILNIFPSSHFEHKNKQKDTQQCPRILSLSHDNY